MDYSSPYGTPPVPIVMPPGTRNYSRYVNGNPVTGTEGSIPPATSFDESQIEIVEVIMRAGIVPTHNDLTQLWQALEALFTQKYITSPITKTVHGTGADFTDLNAAMQWLGQYIITATGSVTFACAPGKWTYSTAVEINHPNANRVSIQGGALLGATPSPGNLTVTGYHNASDGTQQIIYLRSVHATELAFTGGVNGFTVRSSGTTLRYLLITGSQTIHTLPDGTQEGNGLYLHNSSINVDGISIWGFGRCGADILEGSLNCITSLTLVIAYCGWQGINIQGGYCAAAVNTAYTILVSNGVSGLTNLGSLTWFGKLDVRGHGPPNGNAAIHCEQGGMIACNPGTNVSTNYAGVIIAGCATILMQSCTISNHSQYALYAVGNATVWVDNSSMQANGTNSIIAVNGAYVEAIGCQLAQPWSPPFNTYNVAGGGYISF